MVGRTPGRLLQRCQGGRQNSSLGLNQGEGGLSGSLEVGELQLKSKPDVADVVDGFAEPALQSAPSSSGNAMDRALGANIARFGSSWLDQSFCDEAIESSIDKGSTHGEDLPDRAAGRQVARYGKTVPRSSCEQTQHRVLG